MITKPKPGARIDPLHPLSKGLVLDLLFNEGSGNSAHDISGNGNHGSLVNMLPNVQGTGWQGDKFGGVVSFDGSNDFITCANHTSLNMTNAITIEALIKVNNFSTNAQRIIAKSYNGQAYELNVLNTGTFRTHWANLTADDVVDSAVGVVTAGQWVHFVFTYNRVDAVFYVDGQFSNSESETGAVPTTTDSLRIGSRTNGTLFFNGSIAWVKIFDRALSAEEAKQLYYDPFCNLLHIPAWQNYVPSGVGLSVPIAMHDYRRLRV